MKFSKHSPPSTINRHLQSVFHYKDFHPEHSVERVVPTGHVFLIIELDEIPRRTFDRETLDATGTFTEAWVSGMHTGFLTISAHEQSEMFVIQFGPAGAYPFMHVPVCEFNDLIVPAESIPNAQIRALRERLLSEQSPAAKFQAADEWLLDRFDETKTPPDALLSFLERLQTESVSRLSDIVDTYPHSHKHLISQFKRFVGLTPKAYQRILRFNDILQRIRDHERIAWADIAFQCGYSDQSHFIREFGHFSGFSPQQFLDLELNRQEPNFFPLNREG